MPQAVFAFRFENGGGPNFDFSKDGRFLISAVVGEPENAPITVVLNWQAALKK